MEAWVLRMLVHNCRSEPKGRKQQNIISGPDNVASVLWYRPWKHRIRAFMSQKEMSLCYETRPQR